MVDLIAHRGASTEEPENTLRAIRRAIDIGVDFIELDVHLSLDQVPIVMHDCTLCRTTNAEKEIAVRRVVVRHLKNLDAGSWFNKKTRDEEVPTLEEVLQLPLKNTGLMVELKDDVNHDLSRAVMQLLRKYLITKLVIGSFFPNTLEYFIAHYPELPLVGIAETNQEMEAFKGLPITYLALDQKLLLQSDNISRSFNGNKIWTFTVDDHKTAAHLVNLGVAGIITNDPRHIKDLIHAKMRNGT